MFYGLSDSCIQSPVPLGLHIRDPRDKHSLSNVISPTLNAVF